MDTNKLNQIAEKRMLEAGFYIDFPPQFQKELEKLPQNRQEDNHLKDQRNLLWISIDNDDSKDLDQLTYAEKGVEKDRIFVAIADVACFVKKSTPIDDFAFHNTTSVYTPGKVFPMLPMQLSTNLSSLNKNQERATVVVEMLVDQEGKFELVGIYESLVINRAQMTYTHVAEIINGHEDKIDKDLYEQLMLQHHIAYRLKKYRYRQGAISFFSKEVYPQIKNGSIVGIFQNIPNNAHRLIENYMIAANSCISQFMKKHRIPLIKRVVKEPKRWDRIVELAKKNDGALSNQPDAKSLRDFLNELKRKKPEHYPDLSLAILKLIGKGEYVTAHLGESDLGHFDLALTDYTHATAPNRRFPDLVLQRSLKNYLKNMPFDYKVEELTHIAQHCTKKEDDAGKVVRGLVKSAIAFILSNQIGQTFEGIITGASQKGTWVRLKKPPIEGKIVKGFEGIDVGDHVTVKLVEVKIEDGFIDFIQVS